MKIFQLRHFAPRFFCHLFGDGQLCERGHAEELLEATSSLYTDNISNEGQWNPQLKSIELAVAYDALNDDGRLDSKKSKECPPGAWIPC